MSNKAFILGILLLLAVPAVSSAEVFTAWYTATMSGTVYCHSGVAKYKSTVFIGLTNDTVLNQSGMTIQQSADPNSPHTDLVADPYSVATGPDSSVSSYSQIDGMFVGNFTLPASGGSLTFTGNLIATFSDGCTIVATITKVKSSVGP
jgi:hypothetical protein